MTPTGHTGGRCDDTEVPELFDQDPLASASLRYFIRPAPRTSQPSGPATRPFSLRHAVAITRPAPPLYRYSDELQVAVTDDGSERPLLLVSGKEWKTKAKSDGDEGEEEDYDWEESDSRDL